MSSQDRWIIINNMFDGIIVPSRIREAASQICYKFGILEGSEAIRISNIIAKESNSGDGKGHFTSNAISNIDAITNILCDSYKAFIPQRRSGELNCILRESMAM